MYYKKSQEDPATSEKNVSSGSSSQPALPESYTQPYPILFQPRNLVDSIPNQSSDGSQPTPFIPMSVSSAPSQNDSPERARELLLVTYQAAVEPIKHRYPSLNFYLQEAEKWFVKSLINPSHHNIKTFVRASEEIDKKLMNHQESYPWAVAGFAIGICMMLASIPVILLTINTSALVVGVVGFVLGGVLTMVNCASDSIGFHTKEAAKYLKSVGDVRASLEQHKPQTHFVPSAPNAQPDIPPPAYTP